MLRKVWLGFVLALVVAVMTAGLSAEARTCRRLTVWIDEYPYMSHPICADLPGPVEGPLGHVQAEVQNLPIDGVVLPVS